MRRPYALAGVGAALLLVSTGTIASATTIDFSNLIGSNGDPYSGSSQSGFDVAVNSGSWFEAHLSGNPVPSIFSSPISSSVRVTMGGGTFTFDSVDLACNNGGVECQFLIQGNLGPSLVMSIAGFIEPTPPFPFLTVLPFAPATIDSLLIRIDPGDSRTTSMNLDNIVLETETAPVPEPTTIALLGTAITGMALGRRRRRA